MGFNLCFLLVIIACCGIVLSQSSTEENVRPSSDKPVADHHPEQEGSQKIDLSSTNDVELKVFEELKLNLQTASFKEHQK